ncbi:hypothetical protein LTR35_011714 [Friedmanniomyces endolithicus]|uniref:Uncharacterized protein n=1 Tax=Friedmanniomyces endolithicus TaxID=329885 RepID=A0A4V5N480_9PEZI|nr:hypothetical protein LTS09_015049 [Friedmanniomyces endolithicus]KAK0272836.1 hypothetical protein LTS00_016029 [Friedmanniomyces endolithicus]KAK0274205.1 hypothetical protein LTR35_011714 [Friedmanniomyces endolithicus]KAK0311737.1 hypothetical protein LTR82_014109 [Friedmanniomyces endolithicus]KAK0983591.1 hypothetical protein LTR54_014256 [Friedmanniomyces endolithicus]
MAPPDHGDQPAGAADNDAEAVPALIVHLAEAAAHGEDRNLTATERRHIGHDVPTAQPPTLNTHDAHEDLPPPAYGENYGEMQSDQDGMGSQARVGDDGRVNIRFQQTSRKFSSMMVPALRRQQDGGEKELEPPPPYIPPSLGGNEEEPPPPPMNVVIHVVGSRGDVQPFVALGKVLKDTYGHRVRLATHPVFKEFVTENGLEFFSIGGDPAKLMAFMVKNPGLMPGFDSLRTGEVGKRRKEVAEYLKGSWRSCFEAGNGLGPEATDETIEDWTAHHPATTGDESNKPFVADCIIANPPSFAHVHCAEKLGIPLHIMFTMPYSPTQAFPHPLANIQSSNADPNLTNYMTYALIDLLTWQGLGDVINRFRQKSLGLEPISLVWAPGMLQRLRLPHTYCWSPALIPKPKDWAQHISISGFFFLNLATNYTPEPALQAFLDEGPPPVYIGFGSIVLDDPNGMTKVLFEAIKKSGQRALVSKGWGGMGADELGKPDGVFMLGNVPHDWLFKHVSCVVHHGGAGTTAAGITAGRPTIVVPFFGDQPFWGSMVARAGAGPEPIPNKELTADRLAKAIEFCLRPESQMRAQELADKIASESGTNVGAQSFHQFLDVDKLRCNVSPSRTAAWRLKRTQLRLSAMAACTLANEGLLDFNDIKLFRSREYEVDEGPWDPISGGASALVGTMGTMMMGVADMPTDTLRALHIHPDAVKRRKSADVEGHPSGSSRSGRTPRRAATTGDSVSHPDDASSVSETVVASGATTPATSPGSSTFNLQESLARIQSPTSPISPGRSGITTSMAAALGGQLDGTKRARSRSRSGSRAKSIAHPGSSSKHAEHGDNIVDTFMDTGKGIRKIVGAGFSSPMDFTMALTKGFHNAPKLYGDTTVRKPDQVTDFKSGVKAASKEFGYGLYDGITGLVTQPMRGAAKEGPAGFIKGIGKGIGGIALKPGAAIFGIPGYTMKGVYKEMQKQFGSSVQNYIIAARTAQGFDEWQASSLEERTEIVQRWKALQKDLKKKRNPDEMVRDILEEQRRKMREKIALREKHASFEGGTGLEESHHRWRRPGRDRSRSRAASTSSTSGRHGSALSHAGTHEAHSGLSTTSTLSSEEIGDEELKEAIRLSVQETSRGNAEEDSQVARAIEASLAEVEKKRAEQAASGRETSTATHDAELERVLTQSLKEHRGLHGADDDNDWETVPRYDDDEGYQTTESHTHRPAMHGSSSRARQPPPPVYDSGHHLSGTTREQFQQQQNQKPDGGAAGEKTQQERTEEEVVMEYVKKQSLLEEKHRQETAAGKGKGKAPQCGPEEDDDEEMKKAMSISLLDNA